MVALAVNSLTSGIGNVFLQGFVNSAANQLIAGMVSGDLDLGQILGNALFAGVSSWATSFINADTLGINLGPNADVSLLGFGDDLTLSTLVESGIDSVITSGLSSIVYGTDFAEGFVQSFGSSLVNMVMADFQTLIGDQELTEGSFEHAFLHGLVGCVAAEATGADCISGAVGGIVQSIYAGTLVGTAPDSENFATEEAYQKAYQDWKSDAATTASLLGGAVGFVFSGGEAGNVSFAAATASSGIMNNYLTHADIEALQADLGKCAFEDTACRNAVYEIYEEISAQNRADLRACTDIECFEYHADRIREAQDAVNALYAAAHPEDAMMDVSLTATSNFVFNEQTQSGHSFWMQEGSAEVFKTWGASNCGGLIDNVCLQSFAHSETMQTMKNLAILGIDFIPGIGDAKGFIECGVDISMATCLGALAGLVPLIGDGARIALKHGDELVEVVAGGGSFRLLDDGIGATRPDLPEGHNWVADADGNVGIQKPDGSFTDDVGEIEGIVLTTNRTFDFSTSGSGTHLTRTTSIDGIDIRINSGHAYNRTHSGGDVSQIGSMDEIETAILNDISSNSRLNGLSGIGNQHTIQVNGQTVIYELSDTPIGPVLGNYYPPNP